MTEAPGAAALPTPDDEPGMAARIRRFDWTATPLGAMADWPVELRVVHDLLECSTAPAAIYWGPELILLYNDAWAPARRG